MKKLLLSAGLVLSIGFQAFAGNGDLIVDGNLGVGTSNTPLEKLQINKNLALDANTEQIGLLLGTQYGTNPMTTSNNNGRLGIVFNLGLDNGYAGKQKSAAMFGVSEDVLGFSRQVGLAFYTSAFDADRQERLRIANNGNVGIGNTSPQASLDLGSSSRPSNYQYSFLWYNDNNSGPYAGTKGGIYLDQFGLPNNTTVVFATAAANPGTLIFAAKDISGTSLAELIRIQGQTGNVGIGTTAPTQKLDVQGQVASNGVVLTSDAKFKKNLLPINTALDKVLNLTGLTYEWKTDEFKEKNFPVGRHYGVIAQEIEKVLPELVNTAPDGTKAVAYTEIIPVLIEAIKEQQKRIELLEKKLEGIGK